MFEVGGIESESGSGLHSCIMEQWERRGVRRSQRSIPPMCAGIDIKPKTLWGAIDNIRIAPENFKALL